MEKRNPGKIGKYCLLALEITVFLAAAYLLLFRWNRFTLSVELNGESELFQEYGESYAEPGARVILRGTRLLPGGRELQNVPLEISSGPDGGTLGKFTLTYSADFLGYRASAQRTVTVIDSVCPVISLEQGEREPTVYASDNVDGDLTGRVRRTVEEGKLLYTVVDSSGNPASASWEIPASAQEPPEITLTGGESMSIPVGSEFTEPGYSAVDAFREDVTDLVQVEGEVIWWEPGVYPVTYTVTDALAQTTAVTRSVEVMASAWAETVWPEEKTIYLTFDDGPSPYTQELLDTLDAYGVKATFFVTDSGYTSMMQEIVRRGHSIGVHSATHVYQEIYASPQAYFQDLHRIQQVIYENTGVWTTLLRFPGGSSNEVSIAASPGIMTTLSTAVRNAGYQYFDWNVDSDDAGSAHDADTIFNNVTQGIQGQQVCIVLQHDTHPYSVEAVGRIIEWGKENGYTFRPLTDTSPAFHHMVHN